MNLIRIEILRAGAENLPHVFALEPDRVLDVPVVWQLTALAEVVDVCGRAAKQLGNLGHIERGAAIP